MNFYKHYLGDFQRDTGHLSLTERGAYLALIHHYYATENPLPTEHAALCRIAGAHTKVERDAVKTVMRFFELRADHYWHKRIEAELEKQVDRCDKNRAIALAREERKRAELEVKRQHERSTNRAQNVPQNEHELEHENSTPHNHNQILLNTKTANAVSPLDPSGQLDGDGPDEKKPDKFPDCPYARLLALWAKHLPHLAQPRVWEGTRKTSMRQRWVQAAKPSAYSPQGYRTEAEGVAWWDSFFSYIANDTRLAAGFESQGRSWVPDLEWVVNAANFQKIIDGKYAK